MRKLDSSNSDIARVWRKTMSMIAKKEIDIQNDIGNPSINQFYDFKLHPRISVRLSGYHSFDLA